MKKLLIILSVCLITTSAFAQFQQKPMLGEQVNRAHLLGDFVAAWFFLEGAGTTVYDLSGNGNTGTLVGSVFWTAGKFGSVIDFPGDDDYITVPDSPLLRFNSATQDFSVFIWAKSTVAVPDDILIDKRDGNDDGWVLRTIGGVVWLSINGVDVKGTIDIGDGNWHLIGAVANRSGNGQVFIDGAADGAPVDISGQAMDTTIAMKIGVIAYGTTNEWEGQLDIPSIYNRALTASEIALLYRESFCMFVQDDVALMEAGIPAPTVGGQVIIISKAAIPLLLIIPVLIYTKRKKCQMKS